MHEKYGQDDGREVLEIVNRNDMYFNVWCLLWCED